MLKNNSATFVANNSNRIIEITQLKNNKITQVDAYTLLQLLEHNNTVQSRYCHKCNMRISYDPTNFHLYSSPQVVNTYLTQGFDHQLKQYILDNFKDVEKVSDISSLNETSIDASKKTNTHTLLMSTVETIVDLNLERYLFSLTSDDLLRLYKKQIILEAQISEELPWAM